MTVKVCPPAVIVPVRSGPLLAATVNDTVPLPDPLLPAVSEIHGTALLAVQAQPSAVCTSNDRPPPAFPIEAEDAESV